MTITYKRVYQIYHISMPACHTLSYWSALLPTKLNLGTCSSAESKLMLMRLETAELFHVHPLRNKLIIS